MRGKQPSETWRLGLVASFQSRSRSSYRRHKQQPPTITHSALFKGKTTIDNLFIISLVETPTDLTDTHNRSTITPDTASHQATSIPKEPTPDLQLPTSFHRRHHTYQTSNHVLAPLDHRLALVAHHRSSHPQLVRQTSSQGPRRSPDQ